MLEQKHDKAPRKELGKVGFNLFQKALQSANLKLSTRYNALYGINDVAIFLLYMCKGNTFAEQAERDRNRDGIKGPGADWFLGKLKKAKLDEMVKRSTRMLRKTIKYAMKNNMIPADPIVAIDKTIHPVYSKNPSMIGLIKTKLPGTKTGEAYITSKIVGDEPALNLGGYIVTRDEFNPFFIGKIIEELRRCSIQPRLVLLDREFFAVDVMQTLSSA